MITLLTHASNDEIFYHTSNIIAKSLKEGKPDRVLSTEKKSSIVKELESIIEEKLPSPTGIKHEGYKIACMAALRNSISPFDTRDKAEWQSKIER